DAYLLKQAICVSRAAYQSKLQQVDKCMQQLDRSPIMTFLGLPWGRSATVESGLGLLVFSLALLTWFFVFLVLGILFRLGIPLHLILLAGLAEYLNPVFPGWWAGKYYADGLLSWIVLATVLLVPFEARFPIETKRDLILRGALWGSLASV